MPYLSLFLAAFIAATLLPFSSEAMLFAMLTQHYSFWGLWCAATLGNLLGALLNWWLGIACLRWQDRRWFPFKSNQLVRAQHWFQRFGIYSLLLAWVPVIGDPLTFVAGIMRVRFLPFLLLVALGKGLRYAMVIGLFMAF
jgi:membrane protein YqaA with SNARE-associated domain